MEFDLDKKQVTAGLLNKNLFKDLPLSGCRLQVTITVESSLYAAVDSHDLNSFKGFPGHVNVSL